MRCSRPLVLLPWMLAAALCACARDDELLPPDVTTALETAFNRDDAAACAAVFAADGQVLPEAGPAIVGQEALQQYFVGEVSREISYDLHTSMQVVRGDLAVEQGTYVMRNVRLGTDVEAGKYLTVWRRIGDTWKISRLIYNNDHAPAARVSVTADAADADH
ncbi:MAG: nuclear transport factor 2 family protein [Steroidobacteraceae bacterium]